MVDKRDPSVHFLVLTFYLLSCHALFQISIICPPQISFHPSLYVPLVWRLFNLILLIAIAELFVRCSTDSVHVKFDGAGIQTDLPGRGVRQ